MGLWRTHRTLTHSPPKKENNTLPIQPPWTNPASQRRCHGKRRYPSITLAETAAEKASYKTGELILAYQCYDCLRFHIGHADASQKIVRKPTSHMRV
ncbi:hypothetical protein [Edaphobacter bradus]|uniref:hypothetical protein n=1 Tax=Edaphobacter bradus TaxID=2259016 RepID=UPI0021E0C697|nr:hypothetical protein [Edaphobacter bradus]